MRIALLCPYSLSRPGGVQGQVLGLARAFGAGGHEVMVLAPAEGPVTAPGPGSEVVVLGRSVPLPANGSVAPVSLGPFAAGRAVRRIRQAGVDIVHLHEPLAPGAGYACLLRCPQPRIGTFHRSGASTGYRLLGPLARWAAGRLDVRCAVSPQAMATAADALGGTYEIVGNGVELDRFTDAAPWATTGPTVVFVGRHERRKGLGVLLDAFAGVDDPRARLWVVGDGPDTDVLRQRVQGDARVDGSGGWTTPSWPPGSGVPMCCVPRRSAGSPSAWSFWRPWRRGRPWWPATSPATPTWPAATPCSFPPGTPPP